MLFNCIRANINSHYTILAFSETLDFNDYPPASIFFVAEKIRTKLSPSANFSEIIIIDKNLTPNKDLPEAQLDKLFLEEIKLSKGFFHLEIE